MNGFIKRYLRVMVIISFTFIAGSCATSSNIYTADGKQGHSINCSGSALNWGMCYEKAGELCGTKGYAVLEKNGDKGAIITANQSGLYGGSVINRSMVIQCKE